MQILDNEYKQWLFDLKSKIRSSQIKAAVAVNAALINFYWELGKMIAEKQETSTWGNKLIDQLAVDLKEEFPSMTGFSTRNLKYCRIFYKFYKKAIGQQAVAQLQNTNAPISQQAVAQLKGQLLTQIP